MLLAKNSRVEIILSGTLSYTRLENGDLRIILDIGNTVQVVACEGQKEGPISYMNADAMHCILLSCDPLSLVALKRTSRTLHEKVNALSSADWEDMRKDFVQKYPFARVIYKERDVKKPFKCQSQQDWTTYIASVLEQKPRRWHSYTKITLRARNNVGPNPCLYKAVKRLRHELRDCVLTARYERGCVTITDRTGRTKSSLIDRYMQTYSRKYIERRYNMEPTRYSFEYYTLKEEKI